MHFFLQHFVALRGIPCLHIPLYQTSFFTLKTHNMKNKIMLAIACTIAMNSYGQTYLGSKDADTLSFVTHDSVRMYILGETGRISINNGPNYLSNATSAVAITKRYPSSGGTVPGSDRAGLFLNDNTSHGPANSQISVVNYYSPSGLHVFSHRVTGTTGSPAEKGIVSEGGTFGFYRYQIPANSGLSYYGHYNYNYSILDYITGMSFIGYESGGRIDYDYNEWKDFSAVNYTKNNSPAGTRYGLKLTYQNQGTAAWGVYQSETSVKNYFNGPSLFGSTTDNGSDKAQVTGGTQTDGFATGIASKPTSGTTYTASNTDHTILASVGNSVITLPDANIAAGKIFVIKKTSTTGSGTVEVKPTSGSIDNFNASSPVYTLTNQYSSVTVQFDGTNYHIIGEVIR
jgi:hypothetical protein